MSNFFTGFFSSILFILLLVSFELLTRKKNYPRELSRKTAHVLAGLFAITMAFVLEFSVFITITCLFTIFILLSYKASWLQSIHGVQRTTVGEIFFPLGILAGYIVANGSMPVYLAAVLILTISDTLAGIIDTAVTSFLVFFGSAFIILIFIFNSQAILFLAAIAFVLTLVEKFSPFGIDNLSIPITAALLLNTLL